MSSFDETIFGRVVGYDGMDEETKHFGVISMVLCIDDALQYIYQYPAVYRHEKSRYIELEYPCVLLVIVRCCSEKLRYSPYAE